MSSSCLQFIGKERRRHPGKGGLINGSGEQKKDKKTKKEEDNRVFMHKQGAKNYVRRHESMSQRKSKWDEPHQCLYYPRKYS